jgi:hypothetical protein
MSLGQWGPDKRQDKYSVLREMSQEQMQTYTPQQLATILTQRENVSLLDSQARYLANHRADVHIWEGLGDSRATDTFTTGQSRSRPREMVTRGKPPSIPRQPLRDDPRRGTAGQTMGAPYAGRVYVQSLPSLLSWGRREGMAEPGRRPQRGHPPNGCHGVLLPLIPGPACMQGFRCSYPGIPSSSPGMSTSG